MRLECRACRGTYDDVGEDGVAYFHVCPLELILTVAMDDAGIIDAPLAALRGVAIVHDQATKGKLIADGVDPATIGVVLESRSLVRLGHRDENTAAREGSSRETRRLKSEGAGTRRVDVADASPR